MTLNDAITRYKAIRTGTKLSQEQMIDAISRLDMNVYKNVFLTHEGDFEPFEGYDPATDVLTVLLVPAPYDDIYIDWLECQNELVVRDYKRYNNAAEVFSSKFRQFAADYNRTHMPVQRARKYF